MKESILRFKRHMGADPWLWPIFLIGTPACFYIGWNLRDWIGLTNGQLRAFLEFIRVPVLLGLLAYGALTIYRLFATMRKLQRLLKKIERELREENENRA